MFTSGFRSLLRGRASPAVSAIVLVALFLAASLLAGVAGGRPALPGGLASAPLSTAAAAASPRATPAAPVHPSTGVQRESGVFFENDSTFATLPANRTPCGANTSAYMYSFASPPYTYYENFTTVYDNCYAGGQSPSTLSLGGNEIGTGYSVLSNQSMVGCSNHPDVETSQVAFALSANAGASYSPPVWIGNTSCAYLQDLEPSFTLSSNGHIYGAFVEANYGNATNKSFPFNYQFRTDDALAFTNSGSGGVHFLDPVTLTQAGHGNISRPEIAAFGKSIYIVYEILDNNSSVSLANAYPYAPTTPISLEELTSTDGGATWSGPVTLPGMNASAGYNAMSPSIAVSSTGTVAVAYATNRSCFEVFFGTCDGYGDNIVVSTSTTNGSSWVGPVEVSPNATGEYQCAGWENFTSTNTGYWDSCYAYMYAWEPSTSVAWSDVTANDLYVAWSGTFASYNATDFSTTYGTASVFAAASNDAGAHWNDSTVAENVDTSIFAYYYNPVINDQNGWVYVSYAEENDTYCFPCAPGTYGSSYWLQTSLNGVQWMHNVTLLLWNPNAYVENAFVGFSESMGFSTGGPVVTFSQPAYETFGFGDVFTDVTQGTNIWINETDWENETGYADLTTAFVWSGNITTVNFTETGLPPGTTWNFTLGSAAFSSSVPTIQVTDVPTGPGLYLAVPNIADGFWTHFTGFPSTNATPVFSAPTNVTIQFVVEYGVTLAVSPATIPDFQIDFAHNGNYYDFYTFGCGALCTYAYPEFPWYFPAGTSITLPAVDIYSYYPVSFWTGTGNGSSTNFGNSTTFTVNGVINETAWTGAYGSYNVTVSPLGLPGGTTYNFTFDGTPYSHVAPTNVTISNVVTGAYTVGGIVAPGTGGYDYFGQVVGGDVVYIPASPLVLLNFTYAYVDVAAAAGNVTFHATGLGVGDPWQLAFNGTTYSSNSPWLNVSTRPGTFAVTAAPVTAAFNDSAEYQPSGVGPTLAVLVGTTYPVPYSPTYRVDVVASTGGTVTGAGSHWLAPGALATYTARANANFAFLGWTGVGDGSYTGPSVNASVTVNGPLQESASFEALPVARFNLTVAQTGLPSGVWWTVELNGLGYSTTGGTLLIPDLFPCSSGSGASYSVTVPNSYQNGTSGIRYVASGFPSQTCTNGATQISGTFTEEFLVTPISAGGGSAAVQVNGVAQSSPAWVKVGTTAGIEASPEFGYAFSGWVGQGPGNYTGLTVNDELTPSGAITETAYFTAIVIPPPATFTASFHAGSSLPAGTAWSLVFNGTHYASTTSFINVSGYVNDSYLLSVPTVFSADRLSEFTPTGVPTSFTVSGGGALTIDFSVAYYVTVQSTVGGTVVSPSSGFVGAGKDIELNATANVGYEFVGWTGTGASSYSGVAPTGAVVVTSPITEVATFSAIPAVAPSSSGLGPDSTVLIVALAVVGLVVGVGIGYVVFRKRSPGAGGSS
ncbi:MAG: hypothetical protein L3K02_03115 [Thermoplasmata archaeon]|nr:hypothetical protein [Thermoplasmata archaeon]